MSNMGTIEFMNYYKKLSYGDGSIFVTIRRVTPENIEKYTENDKFFIARIKCDTVGNIKYKLVRLLHHSVVKFDNLGDGFLSYDFENDYDIGINRYKGSDVFVLIFQVISELDSNPYVEMITQR